MISAEQSDVFDVLALIAFALAAITRAEWVAARRGAILANHDAKLVAFVDFVLAQCVAQGEAELDRDKLGSLLALKYHTVIDATAELGRVDHSRHLYRIPAATVQRRVSLTPAAVASTRSQSSRTRERMAHAGSPLSRDDGTTTTTPQ
jgi:hypothetical protein